MTKSKIALYNQYLALQAQKIDLNNEIRNTILALNQI